MKKKTMKTMKNTPPPPKKKVCNSAVKVLGNSKYFPPIAYNAEYLNIGSFFPFYESYYFA